MLAEEGEHPAPAIHCLLGPVEWPVPIEDAVAGTVVAIELVHLAVLIELGPVLVHLLGARRAVVVAEYAEQRAAEVLRHVDRRDGGHSPVVKSHCWRPSPTRPSSPSKTYVYSTRCRPRREISKNPSNDRPQRPKCCAIEDPRRELRLERTRPDGRIVEVRRNPVPDGGFVLIYSDITKRKRAEEAIRAARDAAEKALHELQLAQASLVHAQKMAALGQLTAGIAHEIKNPLNFVNNFSALSNELIDEFSDALKPVAFDDKKREELDELTHMS